MKRKRKVKITITHRRRVNPDQIVTRLHCPACGHEIKTPGSVQAEAEAALAIGHYTLDITGQGKKYLYLSDNG